MKLDKLFVLSVLVLAGCQHIDTLSFESDKKETRTIPVTVSTLHDATKVTAAPQADGIDFFWEKGDLMGVYVFGKQYNRMFRCTDAKSGSFQGSFIPRESVDPEARCRAYYPYNNYPDPEDGYLKATLPALQKYPYDNMADFIVSDLVTDYNYDESNLGPLNFALNKHLFCLAKVTLTNSNDDLASETISHIRLETEEAGGYLAGAFTYNLSNASAEAVFSDDPSKRSTFVDLDFGDSGIVVGKETHTFYMVVRPCTIASGKLKLTLHTESYSTSTSYDTDIVFNPSKVKVLPSIDLGASMHKKPVVVLWGDSITSVSYLNQMKAELEPEWRVIRSGVGGDNSLNIMVRQGGNQLLVKSDFTLPASSSEKVRLYARHSRNEYGEDAPSSNYIAIRGDTWITGSGAVGANFNPVVVDGIECTISATDRSTYYIQRNADAAESTVISAGTPIYTYAQRELRDCDLMVIHMGTNGGYKVYSKSTGDVITKVDGKWPYSSDFDYRVLVQQYRDMIDYATNHKAIVLGYHYDTEIVRSNAPTWCEEYVSQMTAAFPANGDYTCTDGITPGVATFIDLKTVGYNNFVRLLISTGVLPAGSTIDDASSVDKERYYRGQWPRSFDSGDLDVHPNAYGNRAIAILVREKIAELKAAGKL